MADFMIGESARLALALSTFEGSAADPAVLRLRVKSPSGAVTTYLYGVAPELVRDGVGQFRASIPLTEAGAWRYRWESEAPHQGAAEGALQVMASRVL